MSLTKTKVSGAITVLGEVIAKKKSEIKALTKKKEDATSLKTQVVDLSVVRTLLAKELKELSKPKKKIVKAKKSGKKPCKCAKTKKPKATFTTNAVLRD